MPIDRFFIGPYDSESGLENDIKPFLIPEKAFASLNNAYCWRGRIRKRFGTRWLGQTQQTTRLRMTVTTITSNAASGIVPGNKFLVGQAFSIGTNFFTVYQTGVTMPMLIDGTAATATFSTTNGAFSFTGVPVADTTPVYWYPAQPVMGMATFQNALIDNEPLIAFDTQFSYQYSNGWDRIGTGAVATWTGSNAQYFWFATWVGVLASDYALFVTNFNQNEPQFMRYLLGGSWNSFAPIVSNTMGNVINMVAALLIIPFKNRLLAFNVWESTNGAPPVQYANRLRFTTVGSPIDNPGASPPYYPWNTDKGGIGGAIDCPMQEAIVTVQYIKDRLIVGMETSSWEIVFTNNQVFPFMWQQINTELGSESTFAVVQFDKVVLSIGNVGIIACTGANVDRIDAKIPDEVFKIQNANSGIQRVYGIRDYFVEMVYWTFPDDSFSATFPYLKKVLVYNYKNGTWSFNDDSFTVFGYFQPQAGILWSDTTILWSDEVPWDSGSLETVFRQTAAGNQEGWTFIVDSDSPVNAASLQITNITNIVTNADGSTFNINAIDYNMNEGDYILLNGISGTGNFSSLNGVIVPITFISLSDANNFTVETSLVLNGVYSGGGTIARVSNINFLTKQYNFYLERGRNFYVHRVDFLVDKTAGGQTQVDYYVSTSDVSMVGASSPQPLGSGSIVGTSILETTPYSAVTLEQTSSQLWHPLYFQGDGQFIQLSFYFNDAQMKSTAVMQSDFQLHAMLFWAQKTSQWFR
jgi:hypothetical protein